ncbi:MAG: DNA-3-methyladenine glycosylase I [Elainellaceae cyanobacterium]
MTTVRRCDWVKGDPLEVEYHDREWGVPLHDDQKLFEFLILEGTQAGLSWLTVLKKRDNYRRALDGFDPQVVAQYDAHKKAELLQNPGIIRNRLKIEAAVHNAILFLDIQQEFGSFDAYLWQFVDGTPIQNQWRSHSDIPAMTPESDRMSKALKKRGFKFVGSTICYALMQAVGMVNDHTVDCFRHRELGSLT